MVKTRSELYLLRRDKLLSYIITMINKMLAANPKLAEAKNFKIKVARLVGAEIYCRTIFYETLNLLLAMYPEIKHEQSYIVISNELVNRLTKKTVE